MKKYQIQFATDSRVAIYVPSTTNATEATDNRKQVENVIRVLSNLFGGATATEAQGGWFSPEHGVILEPVTIVYSFCKQTDLQNNLEDVINLCMHIKNEMKQEAVTLEINGQAAFI